MLFDDQYIPGLSLDCVIFGFHDNQLRVLLLEFKNFSEWGLPGGFVEKNENVEQAAVRVLKSRTGLEKIFLTQFHFFGDVSRNTPNHSQRLIEQGTISKELAPWFEQRFNTIGYYALVEYSKVKPVKDDITDSCEWRALDDLPKLILDHKIIINKALDNLRIHLNYHPIGQNLLPSKFTMPELQALYETVLDKKLDRRNFQRKMLGYGILDRLDERRLGGAHKAPYLYCFNSEKYQQALKVGLNTGW